MADSKSKPDQVWSLKEGLVAIPFLASALALSWEVGYFLRLAGGSFGLFSLSEHITFAIQALPVALAIAMLAVFLMTYFVVVRSSLEKRSLQIGARIVLILATVLVAAGAVAIATARTSSELAVPLIFAALLPVMPALLIYTPKSLAAKPWILICIAVAWSLALAFGLGNQTARNQIQSNRPLNIIRIAEKGAEPVTEIKVRIMRTGERGVLFF